MLRYGIPDPTSEAIVGDWIEFYIAFLKNSISKTEVSSYISAAQGSDADDSFIDSVWNVLRDRARLYGDYPPFDVLSREVVSIIDWEKQPEYLACLIYALEGNPNTPSASASEAGKYFERISNEAIQNYLNGQSVIYGFPTDQNIEDIAKNLLFERFNYLPPAYRKDRDLDIIAWIPWGDNRSSQIVLFIQCAAGFNWKTKLKDLNLRAWERYVSFAAKLIRGFSIPGIVQERDELLEISNDGGIIIDRTRLYRQTVKRIFSDTELRNILLNWCKNRIAEINN